MPFLISLLTFLALSIALPAYAYIGPGLGVAAVWVMFGPFAAIGITVAMIAYFPLRYLWKKWRRKQQGKTEGEHNDGTPPPQDKP